MARVNPRPARFELHPPSRRHVGVDIQLRRPYDRHRHTSAAADKYSGVTWGCPFAGWCGGCRVSSVAVCGQVVAGGSCRSGRACWVAFVAARQSGSCPDRALRRRRNAERGHRLPGRRLRGRGVAVAETVQRDRLGRAGRPASVGSAATVRTRGGGWDQGDGVRTARAASRPVVSVELGRAGGSGRAGRAGVGDLVVDGAALVARGGHQAVALPVLDLPSRPRLRRQGRPRPGPVRPRVERRAARRRRLRDLRRREVPATSPPPLPPAPPAPARTGGPGRVRVRAGRHARLHGRLRRPPGPPHRQRHFQDRHRPLHGRWPR